MRTEITTQHGYHTARLLDGEQEVDKFQLKAKHMPPSELRAMIPADTEEGFQAAKETVYEWLGKQYGMGFMKAGNPIEVWTEWPDGRKDIVQTDHLPPETMARFSRMIDQACDCMGSTVSCGTDRRSGAIVVCWCHADNPPEPFMTIPSHDKFLKTFLETVFYDAPAISLHDFLCRTLPHETITPPPGTKHEPKWPE